MDEKKQPAEMRRRRTRAEVEQLAAEFEASGLSKVEFCRNHGLSLSTLSRYRNRPLRLGETAGVARWVAVEVAAPDQRKSSTGGSGLAVESARGWRIEVGRGFDPLTLAQLLKVLERG
jgi:hypothetical protein